ncbi:unnamed protein product [Phytophthora fragariaefolia]|uniref:Unnamed protein product n=1 Tax=Phytophthora fragariaefolia TaxID=1490495 RepID=A0A9W6UE44_9STRA|nr:unnamed protein product [Phytophthora fragariaefolia]
MVPFFRYMAACVKQHSSMANAVAAAARRERLEALQRLSDEGRRAELQSSIAHFSTKELRSLCGGFGVPAQSKEYAAYQSKAGYAELLLKLLEAKTATLAVDGELAPLAAGLNPSGRTRKSKNCSLRLVNVLFSDAMAPLLREWTDEGARRKRNVDGSSPFWERVRAEFVSANAEYARVACPDDQAFVDFNLGSPIAHSSDKLRKMWEKLGLAYASVFSHFSLVGDNAADLAACAGRLDVYYLRRWLVDKPELLTVVLKAPTEEVGHGVAQSVFQTMQGLPNSLQQVTQSFQPSLQQSAVASEYVQSKEDEGERLMKSIKLAYDVLIAMPAGDRGSEIENTVRRRLQRCAKRLKVIEDEEEKQSMPL